MTDLEMPLLILAVALTIAVISDVGTGRIPNWLTLSLILFAPIYYLIHDGADGLMFSLSGIGVGICAFIIFYIRGGMGAGDVKLMGAVGGLLGPKGAFLALLGTSIVGGVYALALLAWHGKLAVHLKKYWETFKGVILTQKINYVPDTPDQALPRLRYGVAIAAGTLLSLGPGSGLFG